MSKLIHPIAGIVGLLLIMTFWTTTVIVELFGSTAAIVTAKETIPWGFLILIPALAVTGATGFRKAAGSADPTISRKRRRMPFIAANGLLILVPAALFLAVRASRGEFGPVFYGVQAIELVAGAVNITLMSLNVRDGLRLTGRLAGQVRSA